MRLIARAMVSQATWMKSSASRSGAGGATPAARMLAATAASARRAACASTGPAPSAPNTRGKNDGCSLPSTRLQSVAASGARADPVASVLEGADRAAAGGDGVDAQHRGAQTHAADHALVAALVLGGVVRDVGRGAAHVEGDQLVVPGGAAGLDGADDAAGHDKQDAVLAAEEARVGEPAVRLHEAQAYVPELRCHAIDVAAQDGGE